MARQLSPHTVAVSVGRPSGSGAPLNEPLVLASNFREGGDYARTHGTPTWASLELAVGALEGGSAVSFSTGMAAAAATLFTLAPKVLVLPCASYLGVRALVADLVARTAMEVRLVDVADTSAVTEALPGADVVWVETPTNPTLDIADLAAIGQAASAEGAHLVVDNTFATPLLQQPLRYGASVVLHSGTKFIGGHSDLMIGLAVAGDSTLEERLRASRLVNGSTPGALEAFLALRGLRTMPLRVERGQASASDLALRLAAHRHVEAVSYPGLSGHPGHAVAMRQMSGPGAVLSFVVRGGASGADEMLSRLELLVRATSLGGVETTIERRQKYVGDARVASGLVRMSVGIEDVEDLWDDLAQALGTV
jgi:cystathionine gamma-synthase